MKTIVRLMFVSLLVIVAAQAFAAEPWQEFSCKMLGDTTEDDVIEGAAKWVKAVKGMKGGEGFEVFVIFPVAAEMGEYDFKVLVTAPSFAVWGAFWDGYHDSPAGNADDENDALVACPDSGLYEGVKIE